MFDHRGTMDWEHYDGSDGTSGFTSWRIVCACGERSWGGSRKSAKAWWRRHLKRVALARLRGEPFA